jgi:hypothetical protein
MSITMVLTELCEERERIAREIQRLEKLGCCSPLMLVAPLAKSPRYPLRRRERVGRAASGRLHIIL